MSHILANGYFFFIMSRSSSRNKKNNIPREKIVINLMHWETPVPYGHCIEPMQYIEAGTNSEFSDL